MKNKQVIGGQAVVEGVLMRSENYYSVAVRTPDGKIVSLTKRHKSLLKRNKLLKLPLIRGLFVLVESLILGTKALIYSSNKQAKKSSEKLSWKELLVAFGISTLLALSLFKFLPLLTATLMKTYIGESLILFNVVEGLVKFAVFIAYLVIVSRISDVKVMFQYHGAEHMAVNCFEAGKALTVSNVKRHTTKQARCGTSFIFMVILVSMLVYLVVPPTMNMWLKYLLRILLLPAIAGVSYELIKLSSRNPHSAILKTISAPGLLIQQITTKKPSNKQVEVALTALKNVLQKEKISYAD